MKDDIRVLILGDEKVGKTSIIKALISDQPSVEVPAVHPPVKFPKEYCLDNCSVTVVDSLYRRDQETDDTLIEEISKANSILLIYDVTMTDTIDRLGSFWMDFISNHSDAPIILVGNKADLKTDQSTAEQFEDIMRPLAKDYKQCTISIEVSAKTLCNLQDLFICAQRVVLYPTSPLYESVSRQLTPEFERALALIFRRCDKDQDFYLNDYEFANMHSEVFQNLLIQNDMDRIKEVVREQCEDGVTDKGMNFHGFLHLQRMMIQRLKLNVCWTLLRYFGFNDKLELEINFNLAKKPTESIELSRNSINFLISVFKQYARNDLLTYEDLHSIFSTMDSPPWAPTRIDEQAWLSIDKFVAMTPDLCANLSSWLALWHMLTLLDYENALKYLVHIGFSYNYEEAFIITKERDVTETSQRRVFCGFVLGETGVGKTSLLNSLLEKEFNPSQMPSTLPNMVSRIIEDKSSQLLESKCLVLIEYPTVALEEMKNNLDLCDVAIVLQDDTRESQEFIANDLYLPPLLPRIRVKTKSDYPMKFSIDLSKDRPVALFTEIVNTAIRPMNGLEEHVRREINKSLHDQRVSNAFKIGLVVAVFLSGIAIIRKYYPR